MTYIEFFDETSTENICACLTNVPERVVLMGNKFKIMKKYAEIYKKMLKKRGHDVEFVCRTINRNNLSNIVEELVKVIETNDDCVIGLTGGEELSLVAAGIVYERYKDRKLQMHKFSIRNHIMRSFP